MTAQQPVTGAPIETVPELAEALRRLRRRDGRRHGAPQLTYREIAAKTGWSRGIVGEYLTGHVLPPADRLDELVQLLGASLAEQAALATARDRIEESRHRARHTGRPRPATAHPGLPRQLPVAIPGFTGRAGALAGLDRLLPGRPGGTPVVVVSGTAGIGKTTLALHWAHRAAARFEGQLYLNLRGFDHCAAPLTPAEAIGILLEALGVPPHLMPAGPEAQFARYRQLLAGRRLLVVLDNAVSAEQVRPLLPGEASCRVLVASRNQLTGLVATEGAYPLLLGLLRDAEARELLAARLGTPRLAADPAAVDRIVAACARLPLALAVVAARAAINPDRPLGTLAGELRAGPDGSLQAFAGTDPSTDIRAVLSWSYRALPPPAARLFRLLALHPGPPASVAALRSLAGVPGTTLGPALDELVRATLVTEDQAGCYTWHDLLGAYAAELTTTDDDSDARQRAFRRVLDHYLHSADAADERLDPYRPPLTLPPPAPGVAPETFGDHAAALAWFTGRRTALLAAVDAAERAGLDGHVCGITRTMAHYLERAGHWQQWHGVQVRAVAAAQRLADPVSEGYARRGLGRALLRLRRGAEAAGHFAAALELFAVAGDHAAQARILFDLSAAAVSRSDHAGALTYSLRALELAERAGHRPMVGRAHNNIAWNMCLTGQPRAALPHCRLALDALADTNDRFGTADAQDTLGCAHLQLGRPARAIGAFELARRLYRDLGHRYPEASTLTRLGDAHDAAGEPEAARAVWQQAVAVLEELDHPDAAQVRARLDGRHPGAAE